MHKQNLTEKKKDIFCGNSYKSLKLNKLKPLWKKGSKMLSILTKKSNKNKVFQKKKSNKINFKSHITIN